MSIVAKIFRRKKIFDHTLCAEFRADYRYDGRGASKPKSTGSFKIVTEEDNDLIVTWIVHYQICETRCCLTKIVLDECKENIYGSFLIKGQDKDVAFECTFDTSSLPFEQILPEIKCSCGPSYATEFIIIIYRDDGMRSSLIEDYKNLMMDNKNKSADVTFVVSGEEFPAYKNIVSARSEVFASILNSLDEKTDRIDILDIEPSIFKHLLGFICYEEFDFDLNLDELKKLLVAADKYSVKSLVKVCRNYICLNFSADAAVDVLVIADRLKEDVLKKACIKFIIENKKEIFKTESYKNILVESRPDLLSEIFQSLTI